MEGKQGRSKLETISTRQGLGTSLMMTSKKSMPSQQLSFDDFLPRAYFLLENTTTVSASELLPFTEWLLLPNLFLYAKGEAWLRAVKREAYLLSSQG
jgi:hypothetical protein